MSWRPAYSFFIIVVAAELARGAAPSPASPTPGKPPQQQTQWDAVLAQRASITRQLDSISRQPQSAERQMASVVKQRGAVKAQEELTPKWTVSLPAVAPAFEDVTGAAASLDCPSLSAQEADRIVTSAAEREALPPNLIRAVIQQESGFHPCAVSPAGAQGLMQLMPATAMDLHVENPFDPKQNVRAGAAYLKQLVTRYGGDLRRALGAYNAGMGRVDLADGIPEIPETENYVSSITGQLAEEALAKIPVVPVSDTGSIRPVTLHLKLGSTAFTSSQFGSGQLASGPLGTDGVDVQLKP